LNPPSTTCSALPLQVIALVLGAALLATSPTLVAGVDDELAALTRQRESLGFELEQYQRTIEVLRAAPGASAEATISRLTTAVLDIKRRLIEITTAEVALLERQIASTAEAARESERQAGGAGTASEPTLAQERERVARLLQLIATYYADLEELNRSMPAQAQIDSRRRALASLDEERGSRAAIAGVMLDGEAGSEALAQITRRLNDPRLPESRRAGAPICGVRTYMYGTLIASENHGLLPVGKRHYVDRIRLQPGKTTLRINQHSWPASLPVDSSPADYLLTLHLPLTGEPELHLIDIADLLDTPRAHIPEWLPAEVGLAQAP
jgi:hypothetical protein